MKKLSNKKYVVYFKDGSRYTTAWLSEPDSVVIDAFDCPLVYLIKIVEKKKGDKYPIYTSKIIRTGVK